MKEHHRNHAHDFTWRQVAAVYPGLVQWIVAKFGPLPDGPVRREDYERFKAAYEEGEHDA